MNAIHSISLTEMDVDAALEFNINQQLEVNGIKELTKWMRFDNYTSSSKVLIEKI